MMTIIHNEQTLSFYHDNILKDPVVWSSDEPLGVRGAYCQAGCPWQATVPHRPPYPQIQSK